MTVPEVVRAMIDASVDAVAVVGPDLELLHFNAAFLQLSGLRPRALRGGSVRGLCHEHFGLETCDEGCLSTRAMAAGRAIRVDEVASHHLPIRLIVVATPLVDENGEIYAVVESYRDVTAESRLQNEYRRLLEQERADKQRLAEDAARQLGRRNDELREANRQLERANSAKSRFLAAMSHEIRTPLSGVIGVAQLLADTPLSQSQRHLVQTLCDSGDTLLTLISNILDFSKIEAERVELERIPFSLRTVLDNAAYIFAPEAQARHLECLIRADPSLPDAFVGDSGRIQQVLVNLCSNAVKFTQHGHVSVSARPDPTHPGRVLFEIEDTGIGIPADRRERLFLPFSQVDDSTTRRFGGTGLGLAITRELTLMMGGEIGVDSQPGAGSRFWISLPLEPSGEPVGIRKPERAALLRVDVVEPSPRRRRSLVDALTWLGVDVHGHERADQVPVELGPGSPALRAAFVSLPDAGDLETLRAIPSLDTVAVTTLADHAAASQSDAWDATLTRPAKTAQIAAVVEQLTGLGEPASPGIRPLQLPAERGRRRILIVEDSPVNRLILSRALERAGYRVDAAEDGRQGVEAATKNWYDLCLIDCQMPVMDGFEATRAIRERERREGGHLRIIALTANVTAADRKRCFDAGMDDFMTKPFQIDRLIERLDELLVHLDERAA